jgi:hypothetical protein
LHSILRSEHLSCAGCGEAWVMEVRQQFVTNDVCAGQIAWICPECWIEDGFSPEYDGPAVHRLRTRV